MSDMRNPENPPPYNPGYQQPAYQPEYPQSGYPQPQNEHMGYPQPINLQGACSAPSQIIVHAPIVQTVPMYMNRQMGQKSAMMTCPSCNSSIGTRVETKAASLAHIWAFVLCIFGCWPCCLLPYCMDSCHDADHYCPHCNAYIGGYKA